MGDSDGHTRNTGHNRMHDLDEITNESSLDWIGDESSCDTYNGFNYDDDCCYNCWTEKNPQMSLEEMYTGLRKVISSVLSNRDSWPFKEPVNEKLAPMYYEVIQNPIDLSVIEKKIADRLYVDFSEVERDFKLLVNNCETYNGPGNGYTLLSYAVWRVFKRSVKRFLNADLTNKEQVIFIYPPKISNCNPRAAIEARRKRRRHQKLKALEILARAAEEAVKITTIRGTAPEAITGLSPPSSSSPSSSKENADSGMVVISTSTPEQPISDAESNSTLILPLSNANLNIGLSTENLTFKSLTEWSIHLRERGEVVKLPQNSVILGANGTPNFKNSFPQSKLSEERHSKSLCSDRLKIDKPPSNSPSTIENHQETDNSPTEWPYEPAASRNNSTESSPSSDNSKRLVIRLSRCDGPVWKAIKITTDEKFLAKEASGEKKPCRSLESEMNESLVPSTKVEQEELRQDPPSTEMDHEDGSKEVENKFSHNHNSCALSEVSSATDCDENSVDCDLNSSAKLLPKTTNSDDCMTE